MDVGGLGEVQSFQAAVNIPAPELSPDEAARESRRQDSPESVRAREDDRVRRREQLESSEGPSTSEQRELERDRAPRADESEEHRRQEEDPRPRNFDVTA